MKCERCKECPFGAMAPGVDYRGNLAGKVVFVGEAPGQNEFRTGDPFVGESGHLLQAASPLPCGIKTDLNPEGEMHPELLIINALKCLPVDKNQNKLKNAVYVCRNRLIEQLAAYPRDIIFAFGAAAMWTTTGDFNLKSTKTRGQILPAAAPINSKYGVACVVHPAFLLRGGGSYRIFKRDIVKGFEVAGWLDKLNYQLDKEEQEGEAWQDSEGMITPGDFDESGAATSRQLRKKRYEGVLAKDIVLDPVFRVPDTEKSVRYNVDMLREQPDLASDAETTGLKYLSNKVLCLGIAYNAKDVVIFSDDILERYGHIIFELFEDERPTWIWHNGKFDSSFMMERDLPVRVDEDTMLQSYIIDENPGLHDLEQLGMDILGIKPYKDEIRKYMPPKIYDMASVPRPVMYDYLARDCSTTYQVDKYQRPQILADAHLSRAYYMVLLQANPLCVQLERRGIMLDREYIDENRIWLQSDVKQAEKELAEIAGYPINPRSSEQVKNLLYEELKLEPIGRIKKKDSRKETLEKLPQVPAVLAIVKARKAGKALSNYTDALEKFIWEDGAVHPTVLLHRTKTGRLAEQKPPMQTIPRNPRIRRVVTIRQFRHVKRLLRALLSRDLSQAELRMLAMMAQDEYLINLYKEGKRKLHDEVAIKLFGENFTDEDKARAKAVNFGIPYGRTAASLAAEFNVAHSIAQKWVDDWFGVAPGVYKFINRMREVPERGEEIITRFGRKRRFGIVSKENLESQQNEACNFPIQSPTSDLNLLVAVGVDPVFFDLDAYIFHLVHDAILTDVPLEEDVIEECCELIDEERDAVVARYFNTDIPFPYDTKVTTHWGDDNSVILWLTEAELERLPEGQPSVLTLGARWKFAERETWKVAEVVDKKGKMEVKQYVAGTRREHAITDPNPELLGSV